MLSDKEWDAMIAEIQSLRYQLTHNIMPPKEREVMRLRMIANLLMLIRSHTGEQDEE